VKLPAVPTGPAVESKLSSANAAVVVAMAVTGMVALAVVNAGSCVRLWGFSVDVGPDRRVWIRDDELSNHNG
jgi:hypothetical protein